MLKSNLNYPYPMLRNEAIDYKTNVLKTSINVETGENDYKITLKMSTNNENINQLLNNRIASKGVLIKSSSVWYRKFFCLDNIDTIIIDSKDIYGKVELLPCIIVKEDIDNFFSSDFEEEFKKINISIKAGEFIALGEEYCFDALLDSDILKNTSSIFELAPTDDKQISYDIGEDKIVIYVPKDIYQNYSGVANSVASPKSILNSILVFPILVSVLFDMMQMGEEDSYSTKKWYKTIMKTIENKKNNNMMKGLDNLGNIENPIVVAQCLTNGLTSSAFLSLKDILESDGDE